MFALDERRRGAAAHASHVSDALTEDSRNDMPGIFRTDGRYGGLEQPCAAGWPAGAHRLQQRDEFAVDDRLVLRLQHQLVDSNESCWQDSSLRAEKRRANSTRSRW